MRFGRSPFWPSRKSIQAKSIVQLPAQRLRPRVECILLVQDDLTDQEYLLGLACHLAKGLGAKVLVEHVVERDFRTRDPVYRPTPPGTAERLIDQVVDRLVAEGIEARGEVSLTLSGFKAEAILSAAAESGADLIVLEGLRFSALLALAGMSPVHRVIRSSPCPVLAVPPARRPFVAEWLQPWHA